jgi:hypothetical protein
MLLLTWLTKRKADKKYNATKRHAITFSSDSSDVEHNETNNETTNDTTIEITSNIQHEQNTNEQPNNGQKSNEHNETNNETTYDTTMEITNNIQYEHNTNEQPHNEHKSNEHNETNNETTSAKLKLLRRGMPAETTGDTTIEITNNIQYEHNTNEQHIHEECMLEQGTNTNEHTSNEQHIHERANNEQTSNEQTSTEQHSIEATSNEATSNENNEKASNNQNESQNECIKHEMQIIAGNAAQKRKNKKLPRKSTEQLEHPTVEGEANTTCETFTMLRGVISSELYNRIEKLTNKS